MKKYFLLTILVALFSLGVTSSVYAVWGYNGASVQYIVTGPAAECSDTVDNSDPEDTLIDTADPGCHSDGNAANSASYVPSDNDETDVSATGPDLIAGTISPTTVTSGAATNFTSTITNQGTAATGAGFNNFFQVANNPSGTGATDLAPSAMGAIGIGGSAVATSPSYTFGSTGTYYVRACADKSSSGDMGTITESNEGNNCTPSWSAIDVVPAAGAPTVSLIAFPNAVSSGGSSWLTINASNFLPSISCSINQGVGSVTMSSSGGNSWTGNKQATNIISQTTFTASCSSPSGSAQGQATVTIISSATECSDGVDNTDPEDTLVDMADPGCSAPSDDNETDVATPECSDGADNDGDSLRDSDDPGCHTDGDVLNGASYDPNDDSEANKKKPIFIEF